MLIPRFTIRWLLALMTVSSVFFLVVSLAVQGKTWAIALSVSVASLGVAFTMYAVFFGMAYVMASTGSAFRRSPVVGTPFATAEPPPQLVPPQEPDTF
jgi:threonine/homoserine/homoserine lactone efflux protein